MLTYPNFQMRGVPGPLEVFAMATQTLDGRGEADPGYRIELVAEAAGPGAWCCFSNARGDSPSSASSSMGSCPTGSP